MRGGDPTRGDDRSAAAGLSETRVGAACSGVRHRDAVRFRVTAPSALGPPDVVRVGDGGRVVTLRYRTADGPIRVDEFGDLFGPYFVKYVDRRHATDVDVHGAPGVWVRKAHDLAYVDEAGRVRDETVRLAAKSLLWHRDGVTFRLEGARSRAEALALAATFR